MDHMLWGEMDENCAWSINPTILYKEILCDDIGGIIVLPVNSWMERQDVKPLPKGFFTKYTNWKQGICTRNSREKLKFDHAFLCWPNNISITIISCFFFFNCSCFVFFLSWESVAERYWYVQLERLGAWTKYLMHEHEQLFWNLRSRWLDDLYLNYVSVWREGFSDLWN